MVVAYLAGAALVLATVAVGTVLWRDADVLALRLPTRVLAPTARTLTRPRDVVEHYQCNRCHVVPGLEPTSAPLAENCVTCHQAIQGGRLDLWYQEAEVKKWKGHLTHLVRTPELATLSKRVKRSWLIAWLEAPHVVRPLYGATMPRLKVGPAEAALIADFFSVTEEEAGAAPGGDAARGAAVYARRECGSCHFIGDAPVLRYGAPEFQAPSAKRRAPDLRYARERMSLTQLRSWLTDPHALLAGTEMPAFQLTPTEVEDLVTFLSAPPAPRAVVPPRKALKLEREVHYPEVAQKLSRHLCFHCHSDMNRPGDQGPGNSGGMGYAGVSLDLSTREGLLRGVKRDGKFRGLPDRLEDGTPRLVASLLARHAELGGGADPEVLGMPLGFPPIADEEIDLINTWIEQGARE